MLCQAINSVLNTFLEGVEIIFYLESDFKFQTFELTGVNTVIFGGNLLFLRFIHLKLDLMSF